MGVTQISFGGMVDAQWTLTICRFFIPFLVLIFVPKGDPVRGRSVAAPPQPPVLCPHPPPPLHLQLLRRPRPLPPMENASLFEFSLCLCPEPVLADHFLVHNGAKDAFSSPW